MSYKAVEWAMDDAPMLLTPKGKPDTTARHVLQAVAEHAHADGTGAHPSVLRIQYRTGYDRTTVQRALRRLEKGGLISRDGTVGGRTQWRLSVHLKRPETDWAALESEEAAERRAAAERKRRSRAKDVAGAASVTVTHSEPVTNTPVTDSESGRHALEMRDVTDFESGRHAPSAALTIKEPSLQPSGKGRGAPPWATTPTTPPTPPRPDGLPLAPIDLDGFTLTDAMRRWATNTFGNALDTDYETAQFIDHHRAEGTRRRNWASEWQKWMRRSARWASERANRPTPGSSVVAFPDRRQQTTNDMFDRAMARAQARSQQGAQ